MTPQQHSLPWKCRGFTCPKQGNEPGENEDAFAWDPHEGLFAVSDGASESIGANVWSRLLVDRYVEKPFVKPEDLDRWAQPLREKWAEEMAGKELAWYAQEKMEQGAFATLLGLIVQPKGKWHAIAVGDSCLFHVREGALLAAFPIGYPGGFGKRPWLIGSTASTDASDEARFRSEQGSWKSGDHLLLMTDALAEWFVRKSIEANEAPLPVVRELLDAASDRKALSAKLDALQEHQHLGNDDYTLVAVTFH